MKLYTLVKALLFSPQQKARYREDEYCVVVQKWCVGDTYEISVSKYHTQENPYNYYRFSNLPEAMDFLQKAAIPCLSPSWTIFADKEAEHDQCDS